MADLVIWVFPGTQTHNSCGNSGSSQEHRHNEGDPKADTGEKV